MSGELRDRGAASASATRPIAEDELYPIVDDTIDLGPLVRDAIVLELPDGAPVPGGLPRPLPAVRGRPQRGRLRLRCPAGPALG